MNPRPWPPHTHIKNKVSAGRGGAHLYSPHSGVSSRTARATQRNPVSKNKQTNKQTKQKQANKQNKKQKNKKESVLKYI